MDNNEDLFDDDDVDPIYCSQCGDQFFLGDIYYIYKGEKYCPYCVGSGDIIGAVRVKYTS